MPPRSAARWCRRRAPPLAPSRLADLGWFGIDPAALQRLAPYVVLLPTPTPVNLNTAAPAVIYAAIDGIALADARRLVQARDGKPLRSRDQAKALFAPTVVLDERRVGVATNHFEVVGRLRLDDRVLEERSLLVRRNNTVDVLQRERRSLALGPN